MQQLGINNFNRAAPILNKLESHTVIKTILSGETAGRIYVDDPAGPAIAFAQFRHRAFIVGDPRIISCDRLRTFFQSTVQENCRDWKVPLFRLSAESGKWIDYVESILEALEPLRAPYQY